MPFRYFLDASFGNVKTRVLTEIDAFDTFVNILYFHTLAEFDNLHITYHIDVLVPLK